MLNLIFRMVIIIVNINIMIMMVKRQACHNKCGNYPNGGIHHILGGRVSPHHYNHHCHLQRLFVIAVVILAVGVLIIAIGAFVWLVVATL